MLVKNLVGIAVVTWIGLGAMPALAQGLRPITEEQARGAVTHDHTGCKSLKSLNRMNQYLVRNDRAAWKNAMAGANLIGECTILKSGERVYVTDRDSKLVRVRRQGQTIVYWTNQAAVQMIGDRATQLSGR
jgi:hypothetical protein